MIVRVSRGQFAPEQFEEIERMLAESGATLIPASRRLDGNLHYDAGIDRASATMVNVSVWVTPEQAQQMATLAEMRTLAAVFQAQGVRFEPIINYEAVWEIDG